MDVGQRHAGGDFGIHHLVALAGNSTLAGRPFRKPTFAFKGVVFSACGLGHATSGRCCYSASRPSTANLLLISVILLDKGQQCTLVVSALPVAMKSPSLNRRLSDQFGDSTGVKTPLARWQMNYNHYRPHSRLDYMAPAAFVAKCIEQGSCTLHLTQDNGETCEILS